MSKILRTSDGLSSLEVERLNPGFKLRVRTFSRIGYDDKDYVEFSAIINRDYSIFMDSFCEFLKQISKSIEGGFHENQSLDIIENYVNLDSYIGSMARKSFDKRYFSLNFESGKEVNAHFIFKMDLTVIDEFIDSINVN